MSLNMLNTDGSSAREPGEGTPGWVGQAQRLGEDLYKELALVRLALEWTPTHEHDGFYLGRCRGWRSWSWVGTRRWAGSIAPLGQGQPCVLPSAAPCLSQFPRQHP